MPAGMAVRGGDWQQQLYWCVAALYVHWPWTWDSSMNMTTAGIAAPGARSIARGRWIFMDMGYLDMANICMKLGRAGACCFVAAVLEPSLLVRPICHKVSFGARLFTVLLGSYFNMKSFLNGTGKVK